MVLIHASSSVYAVTGYVKSLDLFLFSPISELVPRPMTLIEGLYSIIILIIIIIIATIVILLWTFQCPMLTAG